MVILDDNFTLRYTLRAFLSLIARKAGIQIGLHTSEDGVQGLGYIFTTNPNIIIIDTTLPKYSGRELIEFLTSNPKYRQSSKSIVLTHDGYIPMDLPREYIVINKQDPQFLNKLIAVVMDILKANQAIPYAFNADFRIKWLGQFTIHFANLIDIFGYRISKHNILIKLLLFFPWLLTQVISSVLLVMLRLLIPENKDSNIEQSQRDAMRFRIRHYPTMVGLLASLLLIFVQVSAFVAGGITLFRLTDRIGVSDAAYGNGYTYRRSITIDETKVTGSSALTDFPVAIAGTYSYLATTSNGGKVTNSNGYDIIFTSDSAGSTQLDHEIERYVASSGEVVMWVRIPSLSATSNTVIYMFYGNSSVTTSQQDIEGTWNSNYKLVHHLEEGSTSNNGYLDSTSNNNDSSIVTIDGTGSSATATGKVGQAVQFDGSNDKIAVPDATSLDITGDYTISIWVKADTLPGTTKSRSVMAKTGSIGSDAAGTQVNYGMGLDNGLSGAGQRWSSTFETSAHADFTTNFAFTSSTGTWYYMVSTFSDSGNAFRMYKDGSQSSINSSATGVPGTNNKDFYIGVDNASDFSSFSEYFDGTLDEVRVSTAAHSADWITTEYNNQNSPSTFYTVGSEEASATVTVSASGNQQSALDINTSNKYVGGMFIFQSNESATLTGVTIAEQGTVNGQTGLDNIKLVYDLDTSAPYDCASESYGGAETQFGSTDTDGFNAANGTSSFSGSVSLTTTQTMCAYIVLDITASPSAGETVELQITNPSTDVSLSSGTVTPGTAVAINGTSTLQVYTDVNVDTGGTQAASVSAPSTNQYIGGKFTITEKTSSRNVTGITIREQGTVDAQSHLDNIKLYYESDTSAPYDCASESYAGTESQFGSTDTDGFSATNGTSAFTGSVAISTTSTMCVYVVLDVVTGAGSGQTIDIDIANASTDVVVSASGVVGPNAAVAISGSTSITIPITLTVGTTGTQTASISVPVTNTHIGGAFSMAAGGDTATVTGITIAEQGTINAQTNLDNIKLYYEKDISAPYDCASESYAGTETQYGSTDTDGFSSTNGTSAFTGSVAVSTTEALCVYVVLDVGSGAANGETIEIQITDPSTNVSISSGTVSPNTAVAISGDTDVINTTTTLTLQVSASTDNAWDSLAESDIVTSHPIKTGGKDAANQAVSTGFRFTNVTIPKAATIVSAKFDLNENYGASYFQAVKNKVYFENADNSATFSTSSKPRNRSLTSGIDWDSNGTVVSTGSWYSTSTTAAPPEMSSLLQTVVDRSGWASGNAVSVIIKDDGSDNDWAFEVRSYSYDTSLAAKLYVTYRTTTLTVSSSGTQDASLGAPLTNEYIGGKFVLTPADATAIVTGITIAEQGTINAQTNLDNIKLFYELDTSAPYDCASESYAGTETQFGSTDTDGFSSGNGTSAFTGSVNVTTSQAMCVYPVMDITSGAGNGETIEIQITNPSTDVTLNSGAVTPATAVAISGTTTLAIQVAPTVTNVTLNGGSDIDLTEATTTEVTVTATVTDGNGYGDISSNVGRLYRSGVTNAEACTLNDNNCYAPSDTQLSGCSGNSCTITMTYDVEFHADPTDTGSSFASEYWLAWIESTDSTALTGEAFSPNSVTDMSSLVALSTSGSIAFGTLFASGNTGAVNQTVTVYNTGNVAIDIQLSGSDLCTDYPTCSGSTIPVGNQEYSLTSFTYGAGTDLTSSATTVQMNLAKPTASPTNSTGTLYWGIAIPSLLAPGVYSGVNTVVAIQDS